MTTTESPGARLCLKTSRSAFRYASALRGNVSAAAGALHTAALHFNIT